MTMPCEIRKVTAGSVEDNITLKISIVSARPSSIMVMFSQMITCGIVVKYVIPVLSPMKSTPSVDHKRKL